MEELTPREIQTRIRAGESVDDLVALSGMTREQIEPFARPVLAERAWLASQAANGQVRRESDKDQKSGDKDQQTLAQNINARLASRGLNPQDISWDAWRGNDRIWTLRVSYQSMDTLHEAVFRYDPTGRTSTAVNDEARWLVGEQANALGPKLTRFGLNIEEEPTIDLSETHHIGRRTMSDGDDYGYPGSRLTQVNGVYDLVDEDGDEDVLYDLLASINEESVRIYEGLKGGTALEEQDEITARTVVPKHVPKPKPERDESKEPTSRIPKSKKRASVPSWDEIMFGSPQVDG